MALFGDGMRFEMDFEAQDHISEVVHHIGESLRRVTEMAAGFTLGAIGYEAIGSAVGGIEQLGRSLIETNATAEQLQQTFAAIYQSGAEAQQAMGWLTSFAQTAPFTRESIQQAGIAIAGIGQDITQVMPPLGNLAAVMGVSLPTAAQALQDAFEGRFAMMQTSLNVTKQQLQAFGLEVDKTGHVTQSSLIPAFEKFVAANYPDGMARQMTTFNGQMSNFVDHLQLIERTAGGAMFERLKGSMVGLIDYMNAHQGEILGMAAAFGEGLANAVTAAARAAEGLMRVVPPALAIVAGAWERLQGPIQAAARVIDGVEQALGTYLGQVVVPAIETALGYAARFWAEHGRQVAQILTVIGTNVQKFLAFVASNFSSYMEYTKGVVQVGWGVIEGVVGGALDLLTGNLDQFNVDWNKGWQNIWDGSTRIVGASGEIMIRLIAGVFDQVNTIEHALHQADASGHGPFQWLYDSIAALEEPIIRLTHALFQPLMDAFNNSMAMMHNLSTSAVGQFLHMPAVPQLQMTMQSPEAAIAAVHATATRGPSNLGWDANVGITTVPVDQAIARLRALEAQLIAQDRASFGGGATFTPQQAQKQGKDVLDAFIQGLQNLGKGGLKLPAGVDTAGLLGAGVGALPVPGAGVVGGLPGLPEAGKGGERQALTAAALALSPTLTYQHPDMAGYGATIASFGMVQRDHLAEMVTLLRQQVAVLTRRAERDEQVIALQDQQLAQQRLTAQASVATAGNTSRLASAADRPTQRSDPRGAKALVAVTR
jgi:hypothetical protein